MTPEAPLALGEVQVIDPGLIKIDDTNASCELVKHEYSVVLTQLHASTCVTKVGDPLDLGILSSEIVAHHRPYVPELGFNLVFLQDALLDNACFL